MVEPAEGDEPDTRHERVKQVFLAALDVPRGRRAAFVATACRGDESLQREVLELFLLHGEADPVLDAPLNATEALAGLAQPAGGVVGPYRLLRELGRGGMGVVHLAERDGRLAAVKLLSAGSLSPEARERFRLEADILRRLDHPGIARVLDSGEQPGPGGVPQPWLAMEYVEGRPLTEHAEAAGLSVEARVELLAAVCDAVQHAHAQGIVHRDLKPSNLLVRTDGRPVVLDFGVARLVAGDERPTELATRTGQLLGTPRYMSPEQVQAEPAGIGPPSDVYSLGIVAYELLAGHAPYEASSVSLQRAIVSVLTVEPKPLGEVSPALRGPLSHIVAMALEKDPRLRYADAGELALDLRRRLEGRRVRARGPGLARRIRRWSRRRRRLAGAAAAVVLATLLFTAWVLGTERAAPRGQVRAAYREAETLVVQAVPLIYEGERTAARLRQGIAMLTQARSILDRVPALRHHDLLLRRLEKDLGTAQFLLGGLTWDTMPYRASLMTLAHARGLRSGAPPGWRADLQVAELGPLEVPQEDLLLLSAVATLGLHRLWGEAATIDAALELARGSRRETLRRFGVPAPAPEPGPPTAAAERFGYCYNALAEITTDAARFHRDAGLARAAVLYSDSAIARRAAFETNWTALGSLLYERGRAHLALAELTGSGGALDSAGAYLRACADFRGPSRPWVFAETREELALLGLCRARRSGGGRERFEALRRGAHDVDTAVAVLATAPFPPAAAASLRSLSAEILVELARVARRPALLDSAEARLSAASSALPVTSFPRHASLAWVRSALAARARYELSGDAARLGSATEALDRARAIAQGRGDSLVLGRVTEERRVVELLRQRSRGERADRSPAGRRAPRSAGA